MHAASLTASVYKVKLTGHTWKQHNQLYCQLTTIDRTSYHRVIIWNNGTVNTFQALWLAGDTAYHPLSAGIGLMFG